MHTVHLGFDYPLCVQYELMCCGGYHSRNMHRYVSLIPIPGSLGDQLRSRMYIQSVIPPSAPPSLCVPLLPEQPPNPLQHTVLLRIIWMVFRRYLEEAGESGRVGFYAVSYALCDL
jgi:hypothetical protein